MASRSCLCAFLLLMFAFQSPIISAQLLPLPPPQCRPLVFITIARLEFLTQLLIFKAEFLLRSSIGIGINDISPGLVQGPDPIGATNAALDSVTRGIIEQFGYNGVGHIRAILNRTILNAPQPRPLINLTVEAFASFLNVSGLTPPFNVYVNTPSFLLAVRAVLSILGQYEGAIAPLIVGNTEQQLLDGIARVNAAELGVINALLYPSVNATVPPTTLTVGTLTNITAVGFNQRTGCGVKDEGLIVPQQLGAERRTTVNVVVGDEFSLAPTRNERETLRIVFATGNATMPGAIFPNGINGAVARLIRLLRLN